MNTMQGIIKGVCPVCGQAHIFEKSSFLSIKPPAMHTNCPHCGYKFEKEAGFFWGAMFVSYAFTVAEIISVLLITQLFFSETLDTRMIWITVATIILLATFNFKFSRIIWIYLFSPKTKVL
jgi:uncharacterized protein (DUF983 family)